MKKIATAFVFLFILCLSQALSAQDTARAKEPMLVEEVSPEFPGGVNGVMSFVRNNLRYPEICKKHKVEAKIMVRFVVDSIGWVRSIEVLTDCSAWNKKEYCEAMAEESKRLVASMPQWKPGMQNGKPVNVYYTLPIKFVLE